MAAPTGEAARPGFAVGAPGGSVREFPAVWAVLEQVADPEIPVLGIVDLGIVRHVRQGGDGVLHVGLTPTYSGCPATEAIRASVRSALDTAGFADAVIEEVLSPPWSSDWLSARGRQRLLQFGIAPPTHTVGSVRGLWRAAATVACPRCGSGNTERISEFGSTPCKAHHRCRACGEPFDAFKCI
ncbi:MAG: phenylacetate-CoA oxygenase subunit PaaJ [Proteobacteria bacterium]|nr:phenylacetate-CoA oxygenase subunit PaaJ [Pseudomonadota bacterium]